MKILVIIVAMLFSAVSAGAKDRQKEVKRNIMEHLKTEGYVPSIDTDGDIAFKVAGSQFYIKFYDGEHDKPVYLEFYALYRVDEGARASTVAAAVNHINTNYKMVRASYAAIEPSVEPSDGQGLRICLETTCYTYDGSEFNRFVSTCIDCVDGGASAFFEYMSDGDEEENADVSGGGDADVLDGVGVSEDLIVEQETLAA